MTTTKQGTEHRIHPDGSEYWYMDGAIHREDGPAVTWPGGHLSWYKNGALHRDDGPAVTDGNGSRYWFRCGQCHREDGPAVVKPDGSTEWYLHNTKVTSYKEFQVWSGKSDEEMTLIVLKHGNIG